MNNVQHCLFDAIVSVGLLGSNKNKVVQLLMVIEFNGHLGIRQNGDDHTFGRLLKLRVVGLLFELLELFGGTDHLAHEAAIGDVGVLELNVLLAVHCYNHTSSIYK